MLPRHVWAKSKEEKLHVSETNAVLDCSKLASVVFGVLKTVPPQVSMALWSLDLARVILQRYHFIFN